MSEPRNPRRTWGFRFSLADAVVIAVFLAAAGGLRCLGTPLWWLLLIVAGHFFLFCNVFRIGRRFEYFWAAILVLNVSLWSFLGLLAWPTVLACQIPITTVLILLNIRESRYHGVFAKRLNPRLPDYLEGRIP